MRATLLSLLIPLALAPAASAGEVEDLDGDALPDVDGGGSPDEDEDEDEDDGLPLDLDGAPEEPLDEDQERALEGFAPVQAEAEPEGPFHQPLRPFAALAVGANLPLDEQLAMGGQARLALGAQLPWLGGRLLPSLELGLASASGSGRVQDERLPDGAAYAWDLAVRQLELGGGLRLRAMRGDARLSPELELAAQSVRVHSVLSGRIGSAEAQPVHELSQTPGWRATGGVAVGVGAGSLLIELGYRSVPLDGVLAGETSLRGLVAGFGFRGSP